MSKKKKLQPVLISSREGMLGVVADLVAAKLEFTKLLTQIEQEQVAIAKQHQPRIDELARNIQMSEAGLHVWSVSNPGEFDGKRSIDLPTALFGFRLGKHKVEKPSNVTWKEIVDRLISTIIWPPGVPTTDEQPIFEGENYVRYGDPEVDKDALLRDRKLIPEAALRATGISFCQEEFFFFEPKSEVLEPTKQATEKEPS